MRNLELLAPAKNLACGIAAVDHGADAVYIGASHHGARASAGNTVSDIATLCQYAHRFGVKIYVTLNTLIYENELHEAQQLIGQLEEAGVDALIIQDMSVLRMPHRVPLHASTQMDTRTWEKTQWLHGLGFERVVLARELSLQQIHTIHKAVPDVELEVFVHGALCVSYSGVCYASQAYLGRSANRGACSQMCRMPYDLVDDKGTLIVHDQYLLSLKDLCLIDHLEELADAGACSFKIEGRLKDISYVKNVVAAYNEALNKLVEKYPKQYCRASKGRVQLFFKPDVNRTFNRGFTSYFLNDRQPGIASFHTPKAIGEYVGRVKDVQRHYIVVDSAVEFANGDGLCFMDRSADGEFASALVGFRVNKADGTKLFPYKMPKRIKSGTPLFRNQDMLFDKMLAGQTAVRKIPITITLDKTERGFSLSAMGVTIEKQCEHIVAQTPQEPNIRKQLSKLGNTIYTAEDILMINGVEICFIPSSILSEMRRMLTDLLDEEILRQHESRRYIPQVVESKGDKLQEKIQMPRYWQPEYKRYPYMMNVANSVAADFYKEQGWQQLAPAFEVQPGNRGTDNTRGAMVMQCRHCIRFTLGFCVKHGGKRPTWKEPLRLRMKDGRTFRLEFKCDECQMNLIAEQDVAKQARSNTIVK